MYLPNPCDRSHDFVKSSQKLLRVKKPSASTYSSLFLIYSRERRNNIQEVLNL